MGTPALLVEASDGIEAAAAASEEETLRPWELVIPELERVLGLSEDSTTEEATEAKELGIIEDVEAIEVGLVDFVVATGRSMLFSGKVSIVAAMVVGCNKVVSLVSEVITMVFEAMSEATETGTVLPVAAVPPVALVTAVVVICKTSKITVYSVYPPVYLTVLHGPWCARKPKQ